MTNTQSFNFRLDLNHVPTLQSGTGESLCVVGVLDVSSQPGRGGNATLVFSIVKAVVSE